MQRHKGSLGICCGLAFAIVVLAGGQTAFGDVYMLGTCPVSGGKLGAMGPPVVKEYDGRQIRFCCSECPAKFEADPAKYLKKVDAAIVKQQKRFYPLETCVVSDEKFGGDMGPAIDYVFQNRLVRVCCKDCVKKLKATPGKYLSKLDKAVVAKQKAAYRLDTCIVSGDKLGGDMGAPIDYVLGNRLIRVCCKDCVKKIEKDPSKFLALLDKGTPGTGSQKPEGSMSK